MCHVQQSTKCGDDFVRSFNETPFPSVDIRSALLLGWKNEHVSVRLATDYKSKSLPALNINNPMKDSYLGELCTSNAKLTKKQAMFSALRAPNKALSKAI